MTRTGALLSGLILASIFAGAAEALDGFVVIDARGLALKPGTVIAADLPLVLQEGQLVTLIAPNGNTLRLRGPYNRVPGTADGTEVADLSVAFKSLITRKGAQTNDVYAVRAGETTTLPDPWVVDASRPSRLCVREGQPLVLWRAETKATTTLTIGPHDHSWKARTTWRAGDALVTIPESVPLNDGAAYTVSYGGSQAVVTLNRVPASLPTDQARAAWLVEAGCEAQANALIRSLP